MQLNKQLFNIIVFIKYSLSFNSSHLKLVDTSFCSKENSENEYEINVVYWKICNCLTYYYYFDLHSIYARIVIVTLVCSGACTFVCVCVSVFVGGATCKWIKFLACVRRCIGVCASVCLFTCMKQLKCNCMHPAQALMPVETHTWNQKVG